MVIVVRAPRYKLAGLFALSVAMVGAGAWLVVGLPLTGLTQVVGAAGMLFFGLCGGWILSRLFSHRVSLILDRDGLLDNSSAIPAGKIIWEQISRIGITTVSSQRFLGIDVKERSSLVSSGSTFRRWVDETNSDITGFPVNIPATTIDRTLEELHDLIARYWKDPKARTELGVHDPDAQKH